MCATQCSSIQYHEHFSNCELINDFILRLFFWHHHITGYEQFKSHCLNLAVSLIKGQTLQIKSKLNEKLTFHCFIAIKCFHQFTWLFSGPELDIIEPLFWHLTKILPVTWLFFIEKKCTQVRDYVSLSLLLYSAHKSMFYWLQWVNTFHFYQMVIIDSMILWLNLIKLAI